MNVANLELCKELYELSGWEDVQANWARIDSDWGIEFALLTDLQHDDDIDAACPAYDLGYLLRKLPMHYRSDAGNSLKLTTFNRDWHAGYEGWGDWKSASTPEDAATKLAIELFKQGVLMKESNRE